MATDGSRVLFWDLSQDARRQSILTQTLALLDQETREKLEALYEQALRGLALPEHHHALPDVLATIEAFQAAERVKEDMRSIYGILARAEAQVHGCPVEKTHFHEVGRLQGVCNVLRICLAVHLLDPEEIRATAVQVGCGTIRCAHGELSLPAPATAAVLQAAGAPVCESRLQGELCTPTSAAVIVHFASFR